MKSSSVWLLILLAGMLILIQLPFWTDLGLNGLWLGLPQWLWYYVVVQIFFVMALWFWSRVKSKK